MRKAVGLISAIGLVLLTPTVALAEDTKPVEVANIATWFTQGDYAKGAILALFGVFGALFVAFTLVGGTIPGTAGKAQLDKDRELLDRLTSKLEEALAAGTAGAAELRAAVNDLRDDYNRERGAQFALGAVLYVLLGAFVATLLAQDILQALAFGAGWTGLVGSLGLKADFEERKAEKDDALHDLATAIAGLADRPAPRASTRSRRRRSVRQSDSTDRAASAMSSDAVDKLLIDAAVARAL